MTGPTQPAARATLEATESAALAEIRRVLGEELQLGKDVRAEDDLLLDLQLDSVSLLTLVVELENAFRIALSEEDSANVRTAGELAALVAKRARETRGKPAARPSADGSSI